MNILILINSIDGLYCFRRELIEKLTKDNTVYILSPEGLRSDYFRELGCQYRNIAINRHGTNPIVDIKLVTAYAKLIKDIKPDVVLTYTVKPNIYGGIACSIMKVPYMANITGLGNAIENGGVLQKIVRTLYKIALKKANRVFFQNTSNKTLFEKWEIVRDNSRLIPGSGVNLEYHTPADYPDDESNIRFLFIGRIMKAKGIDELLSAIKIVHQRYPNTSLDIVGGLDGDYKQVMEQANQLDYIRYHGLQNDVRPFIRNAHCTVLPSYNEGTANVLLESASAARPVIATRVPGCKETYDDDITGLGCDVRDAVSLADAMIQFINLPHTDKEKMGKLAREKMEREYDRNIVIRAYLDAISEITEPIEVL